MHIKILYIFFFIASIAAAQVKKGTASYYAPKFEGRRCASGEIFRNDSMTCAHKTLPFGTLIKVCGKNNQCVVVKVNDRLGKKSKRTIDLTQKAAKEIGLYHAGIMKVSYEVVGKDSIHVAKKVATEKKSYNKKKKKKGKKKVVKKK
jgi:rare lipoprotein A